MYFICFAKICKLNAFYVKRHAAGTKFLLPNFGIQLEKEIPKNIHFRVKKNLKIINSA